MGEMIGIALFAMAVLMVLMCTGGSPAPKPDPDENRQHELAKQMLRGNTTPEKIAEEEGYDLEHVKKWKDDYVKIAVDYALDAEKHNARITLMEDDIQWFKAACRKYIGEDWEAKTGYTEHELTKHK